MTTTATTKFIINNIPFTALYCDGQWVEFSCEGFDFTAGDPPRIMVSSLAEATRVLKGMEYMLKGMMMEGMTAQEALVEWADMV